MIGIYIITLEGGFRLVPITQTATFDHQVGGIRTSVQYGANCSWSWVRSLDEVVYFEESGLVIKIRDLLEQYPNIAVAYTPEEVFGYSRQVRDAYGTKVFEKAYQDGEVVKWPVMEAVDRDETAWAAYASCHNFTIREVTDELGTRTVTPAILQHKIGKHPHLITDREYHL